MTKRHHTVRQPKCHICRGPACYRSRLRGMRRWVYLCGAHSSPMMEARIQALIQELSPGLLEEERNHEGTSTET